MPQPFFQLWRERGAVVHGWWQWSCHAPEAWLANAWTNFAQASLTRSTGALAGIMDGQRPAQHWLPQQWLRVLDQLAKPRPTFPFPWSGLRRSRRNTNVIEFFASAAADLIW